MKAPSMNMSEPRSIAGPSAALFVAFGGAVVVIGAMLLVAVPELSVANYFPDFEALQSLIMG
jgi:hypothetical protein